MDIPPGALAHVARKLLVTGMPRSGTRYIRSVLVNAKVNVGHETLKEDGSNYRDGVVSCWYAWDDFWYPGDHLPRVSRIQWEHCWHQTRDPRKVLPSMLAALRGHFWHWQEKHTGVPGDLEPALVRCALIWMAWTQQIEATRPDWTYRIEDIDRLWPEMRERLGLPSIPLPDVARNHGHHSKSGAVSWEEIEALDAKVCDRLRQVAASVGYED